MFEIKVYDNVPEVLEHIAEQLMAYSLRDSVVHIALSGGSTPQALYRMLATNSFKDAITWDNLHFWWGDERMVDLSSDESNVGVAKRMLFDHIAIPIENLHPIDGSKDIETEIQRMSGEIAEHLPSVEGLPSFDWVLLGLGEDGHTASLFSDQVDYDCNDNWVEAHHPLTGQKRISLSAEVLCNAQQMTFVVTGESKASIVDKVFADDEQAEGYPAANIFAFGGETQWVLDGAAASLLMRD